MKPKDPKSPKWYYSMPSVIIALITVGPLAFPLLWKSPRFNLLSKISITLLFIVLTILLTKLTWHTFSFAWDLFKQLGIVP